MQMNRNTKQVSHSMYLFKNNPKQAKKSQPNTPSQASQQTIQPSKPINQRRPSKMIKQREAKPSPASRQAKTMRSKAKQVGKQMNKTNVEQIESSMLKSDRSGLPVRPQQ